MSNIENIFADRRKKEQELKLTYSKYIFNSHLIMFLIIVLGAALINYSKWIAIASQFELYSVLIAAAVAFSYFLVSTKIKTYIKEADAVFLLPLEKYYKISTHCSICYLLFLSKTYYEYYRDCG